MMQDSIITVAELRQLLNQQAEIQLVDVRTLEKHEIYNIGGKHIPRVELPDRLHELDPEKLIITYCTSGGSSMHALQFLMGAGFKKVKSLEGGVTAYKASEI